MPAHLSDLAKSPASSEVYAASLRNERHRPVFLSQLAHIISDNHISFCLGVYIQLPQPKGWTARRPSSTILPSTSRHNIERLPTKLQRRSTAPAMNTTIIITHFCQPRPLPT